MGTAAGEGVEVFVDYGSRRGNANLLMVYGFVARPNPMETVDLPVPDCVRGASEHHRLLRGFMENSNRNTFKAARVGVDLGMKRAIRIACSDADLVSARLEEHVGRGLSEETFWHESTEDDVLESRVLQELLAVCEEFLASQGHSQVSQCQEGAVGDSGGERERLAASFRLERGELVQQLREKLLSQMPGSC
eukprot:TRINITY_DN51384_c0_g1_i1.p1 TRINITY_DN51384_c0_g1~~TRINITY_DN51384_c0_g1_i1.p1  ORF type:complete len:192 (+),score=34.75 TRINITY_DN51384_c0_g1_i1:277-852(+)